MMWFKAHWFQLLLWAGFIYGFLQLYVSGRVVQFLDHANERSLHQNEILTGGGFFLFTPLAVIMIWQQLYLPAALVFCLSFVGVIDDIKHLSARFRLIVQVVVVLLTLWWLGFSLSLWSLFIGLAFLWWLNLFNFMDGANGLVALHAFVTLSMLLWLTPFTNSVLLVVLCLLLALLVYLYFNVLLKQLFMGDSGSLPLAYVVALVALLALQAGHLSTLQIAVMHAVFITDATLTLVTRWYRKERLSQAHRSHLYQRLISENRPHWQISLLYCTITLACCLVAIVMDNYSLMWQLPWFILVYAILMSVFFQTRRLGR